MCRLEKIEKDLSLGSLPFSLNFDETASDIHVELIYLQCDLTLEENLTNLQLLECYHLSFLLNHE